MATGRRRGRALIYVALILILLLILVFVVARFGLGGLMGIGGTPVTNGQQGPVPTPSPTPEVKIVYIKADIKRGDPINSDQIEARNVDPVQYEQLKPENYFGAVEYVLDGKGRALYDLRSGYPLERSQVYTPGLSNRLPSFEIPTGKVAISIPINRLSSVSYGLQKGDHVNVLVSLLMLDVDTNWQSALPNRTGSILAAGPKKEETQNYLTGRFEMSPDYTSTASGADSFFGRVELEPTVNQAAWLVPGEAQRPRLVSQTLLQDAIILQMGNFDLNGANPTVTVAAVEPTAAPGAAAPAATGAEGEVAAPAGPQPPNIITLIVDPQDAVTIDYLLLAGAKLNLVMRSAGDTQRIDTEAVTLQFILDQYQIPNPAKLPYSLQPRMDAFPEVIMPFPEPGPLPTPVPPQ